MQQPNDEGRKNSANVPNLSLSGKFSPVIFAFLQRARNIMFRFVPGRTGGLLGTKGLYCAGRWVGQVKMRILIMLFLCCLKKYKLMFIIKPDN